jgi:hypothetical protein
MKKTILILAILSFTTGFSQTKKVCVKIEQFIPYCGGARPTPEMEAKLKIATPYANKKLIYVSENNKVDTITTDKNGCLKTKLPQGKYNFFEPWKYYKQIPNGETESNIKMDCIAAEWAKADLIIIVAKKNTIVNNLIYPACAYRFPCLINKHLPQ